MPELAKSYEIVHRDGRLTLLVDDAEFPWHIAIDGPLVEAYDDDITAPVHILWLPVIVDRPMPTPPEGHPDGEPVDAVPSA